MSLGLIRSSFRTGRVIASYVNISNYESHKSSCVSCILHSPAAGQLPPCCLSLRSPGSAGSLRHCTLAERSSRMTEHNKLVPPIAICTPLAIVCTSREVNVRQPPFSPHCCFCLAASRPTRDRRTSQSANACNRYRTLPHG